MRGGCLEKQRDKPIKRRFSQEKHQVRKEECLTGNNLVPEAAGALLISPGWGKKSGFIKDSSKLTLFFVTASRESLGQI